MTVSRHPSGDGIAAYDTGRRWIRPTADAIDTQVFYRCAMTPQDPTSDHRVQPGRPAAAVGWPEEPHAFVWTDALLVAALLVFGLGGTAPAAAGQGLPPPSVATYALVIIACLGILFWRWRPLSALAITGAAISAYLLRGAAHGPILVTGLIVVYGVAVRYPPRRAVIPLGMLLAAVATAEAIRVVRTGGSWFDVVTVSAWMLVPFAFGVAIGARRQATTQVRTEQARRMVADERLRMAGEIHDVVGHGLAVIAMQAGAALHVLDSNPVKARESLEAIRTTSKASLDDLRAELDVLSGDHAPGPRRPTADLDDLAALVDRIRTGGLDIRWHAGVDQPTVAPEVARDAYRIVQEALTNVLKHAGPAAAVDASVTTEDGALHIDVTDTGAGPGPTPGHGSGIDGMRRRAETLGGSLEASGHPGGGFAVRGHIPLQGGRA